MAGTSSIGGVISGLDTNTIISKMMDLERMPLKTMQYRQAALQQKLAAWQEANTRVLALKIKADTLVDSTTFDIKAITSSDESILTAATTQDAQAGTYYLKVNHLTRTHQIKSAGFANATESLVGKGTVTVKTKTGEAKTITIDDTNNSLQGLRDAINKSGAGVSATIINDGTPGSPYKLMITSNTTGTDGEITINTSGLTGGTDTSFTTLQTAQDTEVMFGDGANGIVVTKKSNIITDLIPGITLNLKNADTTKTITVEVKNDTETIKTAIKDFVTQYNNLMDFIKAQNTYDQESNIAGILFADSSLQSIQAEIRSKVAGPVTNLGQSMKMLANVGITAGSDDKLTINDATLTDKLNTDLGSVKRLFSSMGESDNSAVTLLSTGNATKMSGANGYAVNITKVATSTRLTAGVAQSDVLAKDELLTINGHLVPLTAGMTQSDVVNKINEYTNKTGVIASMTAKDGTGTGNFLSLKRVMSGTGYGIAVTSTVSNGGTTPVSNSSGFGSKDVSAASPSGEAGTGTPQSGTATIGSDVEGTINGEPAEGKGNILKGKSGNANTDGLELRVDAHAPGNYGTIRITKGVAGIMSDYIDFITKPKTGTVMSAQDTVTKQIGDISTSMATLESRLTIKEDRLVKQFAFMESSMSKLNSQGNAIASLSQKTTSSSS